MHEWAVFPASKIWRCVHCRIAKSVDDRSPRLCLGGGVFQDGGFAWRS